MEHGLTGGNWWGRFSFNTGNRPMTDTDDIDATILDWHAKDVGPGGIANVLEALGLGRWTAEGVRAALKRLGIKADTLRAAEAVFTPGEEGTAEDYEAEGWADHCGEKFIRPWLDSAGRNVRDTGAPGEQGGGGGEHGQPSTTFADRAVEHLERREKDDQENPFKSTAKSYQPTSVNWKRSRPSFTGQHNNYKQISRGSVPASRQG